MNWRPAFSRQWKETEAEVERWVEAGLIAQPVIGQPVDEVYAMVLKTVRQYLEGFPEYARPKP